MKYSRQISFSLVLILAIAAIPKVFAQPVASVKLKGKVEDDYLKIYTKELTANSTDFSFQKEHDILNRALSDGTAITLSTAIDKSVGDMLPLINPDNPNLHSPRLESRKIQSITIAQTLDVALSQNLQIAIAQEQIPITKWNYVAALGGFLPSINLDLNQDGSRSRAAMPPARSTNHSLGLSARLDYPLFQGGKILFTSLASHSFYQASKGQFAAARNDILNAAVTAYYNLLANQAILRIRLDSARFSAKQVFLYKNQFVDAMRIALRSLNELTVEAETTRSLSAFTSANQNYVLKDLQEIDDLDLIKVAKDPSLKLIAMRINNLKQQVREVHQRHEENLHTWIFVHSLAKVLLSNERAKLSHAENPKLSDQLSEESISTADPGVFDWQSTQTRFDALADSWASLATTISFAKRLANEALIKEKAVQEIAVQSEPKSTGKASTMSLCISQWQSLQSSFAKLEQTVDVVEKLIANARMQLRTYNSASGKIDANDLKKNIQKTTDSVDTQLKEMQNQLEEILEGEFTAAKLEERLLGYSDANVKALPAKLLMDIATAQIEALSAASKAQDASKTAALFTNQFGSAFDSNLDRAKQVADLISQISDLIDSNDTAGTSNEQETSELAHELIEAARELQLLAPNSAVASKIKKIGDSLVLDSGRLLADSGYRRQYHVRLKAQLQDAQAKETIEAGLSFKLDQWRTQLGSDLQDLINQIVAVRVSSINLSALLNMDPQVNLMGNDVLSQSARDLKGLPFPELVRKSLTNRPELYQFDELRKAALANVGVAISQLLPTFSIFAETNGKGEAPRARDLRLNHTYAVGYDVAYSFANLLLPSFASARAQGAVAHQAYLNFRQQLIAVLQQVHQSYVSVQTAGLKVAAAAVTAGQASDQLMMADTPEKRMKSSASNLDLIQALKDRNSNLINLANNIAAYNTAQAQLLHDIGEIFPVSNYLP